MKRISKKQLKVKLFGNYHRSGIVNIVFTYCLLIGISFIFLYLYPNVGQKFYGFGRFGRYGSLDSYSQPGAIAKPARGLAAILGYLCGVTVPSVVAV